MLNLMNLTMLNWFIINWVSLYYKLGHVLQCEATLLQSEASIITKEGNFALLQSGARAITKRGR